METDTTRMCALLVGLPDVTIAGVGDWPAWLGIMVKVAGERPVCPLLERRGTRDRHRTLFVDD